MPRCQREEWSVERVTPLERSSRSGHTDIQHTCSFSAAARTGTRAALETLLLGAAANLWTRPVKGFARRVADIMLMFRLIKVKYNY